jgi:hypothetical protein
MQKLYDITDGFEFTSYVIFETHKGLKSGAMQPRQVNRDGLVEKYNMCSSLDSISQVTISKPQLVFLYSTFPMRPMQAKPKSEIKMDTQDLNWEISRLSFTFC